MAKSKDNSADKPRRSSSDGSVAVDGDTVSAWSRTVRETIESVVIAFVLAFLFRTFEAEAFVIPTGSMAPTLMGRHLDVTCPKCGFPYQVGAGGDSDDAPAYPGPRDVRNCLCPNCRFMINFADMTEKQLNSYPFYNGDRILVSKFAFDFTPPKRWDVIVFKYPEDAKTNYIKRLIGLPGDVIRIRNGEIAVSHDGGKTFDFARKEPAKIRATLQTVYDNDFVFEPFLDQGWPARWQSPDKSWANSPIDGTHPDPKVFVTSGKPAGPGDADVAWLNYYNYVPQSDDWGAFDRRQPLNPNPPVQPITDFIAYDAADMPPPRGNAMAGSDHPVVSDLAIECELNVKAAAGKVIFQVMKKGQPFRCQLDLAKGTAELSLPNLKPGEQPRATQPVVAQPGAYRLLFANVDHQLTLIVNGKPIQFDKPTTYDELTGDDQADRQPDGRQSPASIGSSGATLTVAHLRVLRDVYYTYEGSRLDHPSYAKGSVPNTWPEFGEDWACFAENAPNSRDGIQTALTRLIRAAADVRSRDQYFFVGKAGDSVGSGVLSEDQFFPLGDNSPLSQDGRFWRTEHFVDHRLLVGKALFIYWPHSFFFPIPNFRRMGFVR